MTRTLNALLACWMAVATTGTVVSHRHAAPVRHSHGYGWLTISPTTDAPTSEARPHHHFVLAGIEFGAIPGSRDQVHESQVVSECPLPGCEPAADAAPAAFFTLAARGVSLLPRSAAVPVSFAPSDLCAVARHARSGVLLS